MEVYFKEFQENCEHYEPVDFDKGECNILIENEAVNQQDDPDFEADSVKCCEANCPFNKVNSPYKYVK
jgi:hypothetical protein